MSVIGPELSARLIAAFGESRVVTAESAVREWNPVALTHPEKFAGGSAAWIDDVKQKHGLYLKGDPLLLSSAIWLMDPFSALVADTFAKAVRGAKILDLCSAPGGKALSLLQDFTPAEIVLNEKDPTRFRRLKQNVERWMNFSTELIAQKKIIFTNRDGVDLCREFHDKEIFFDAILLDAPCTSESFFFKRSELRKDVSEKEITRAAKIQADLLRAAFSVLRPGGVLLYATCTYNRSENQEVIQNFGESADIAIVAERLAFCDEGVGAGGYFAVVEKKRRGSADQSLGELSMVGMTPAAFDRVLRECIVVSPLDWLQVAKREIKLISWIKKHVGYSKSLHDRRAYSFFCEVDGSPPAFLFSVGQDDYRFELEAADRHFLKDFL